VRAFASRIGLTTADAARFFGLGDKNRQATPPLSIGEREKITRTRQRTGGDTLLRVIQSLRL
jgi:hypothetical protein